MNTKVEQRQNIFGEKIIDISPIISEKFAVFPGDYPFQRFTDKDVSAGDTYSLSHISTTLHVGAHADASSHYHKAGKGIDQVKLSVYMGLAQVIEINAKKSPFRILPTDLLDMTIMAPRILFKTQSQLDPDQWQDDFTALSPELIEFLANENVELVGIDTPSVDPADSKQLESHLALFKYNMANLENLYLSEVEAGLYHLVALPLKIKDADASPVRAVLLPIAD